MKSIDTTAASNGKAPSYEALLIIAQSVCGALSRAGVTDCDDPGEAIDVMREKYEERLANLSVRKPDSAAPGGDVERMNCKYTADSYGNIKRDGAKMGANEIIAALSAPKQVELDAAYMAGRDAATTINVCDGSCTAPQPVEAEGREPAGYVDPQSLMNLKQRGHMGGVYRREWIWANHSPGLIPIYTTPPPEQPAIDLEQFKALAAKWRDDVSGGEGYNYTAYEEGRIAEKRRCADHLTAIIDGAKGEGGSHG